MGSLSPSADFACILNGFCSSFCLLTVWRGSGWSPWPTGGWAFARFGPYNMHMWLRWDTVVKGSRMRKNTAYSPRPGKHPEGWGAGRGQGRPSSRASLVFCILLSTTRGGSRPVASLGDPVAFSVGRTEGLLGTWDSPLDDLEEITSSVSTNINIPGNLSSTAKK